MKTFIPILFVAAWLAGCTSTQQWLAGKPEAFRQGYEAGCENAKERVSNSFIPKKNDTERYKNDSRYKAGWDEGYEDCRLDKETDLLMQRPGLIP